MDSKDVDLPHLDDTIVKLSSDFRRDIAETASRDLYVFCKSVLGYKDMTERAHGPMCVFLDRNPAQFKAVGMPRDTFKTSIANIGRNLQGVVQNPNETRLIRNETGTNAARFLGAIAQHAESNRVFRALYSYIIPKDFRKVTWNNESLQFNRDVIRPEPTIDSLGMTAAATSRHYDHLTYDDIISEEAIASPKVMEEAIRRAVNFRPLMREPSKSTLTIAFTRWAFYDVYKVLFDRLGSRLAKMIRGATENGEPIFPEHLSLDVLAQIRDEIGEYMYSCLYMNNPRNEAVQDFNIKDLKFFRFSLDGKQVILYDRNGAEEDRWDLDQLDITATIDLAAAEKLSSDRNAISVTGVSPKSQAISLESWAKRCSPLELMSQVFLFHRMYHPRKWGIENVAYQASFKYFVKDYSNNEDLYLNVVPITAIGKKTTRIRCLQPIAATGRLYLRADQTILRDELSEFPLGEHEDALDALSMQLQLWKGQMSISRWKRYKESEKLVLGEIHKQHLLSSGQGINEDDSDLRPTEIYEIAMPA